MAGPPGRFPQGVGFHGAGHPPFGHPNHGDHIHIHYINPFHHFRPYYGYPNFYGGYYSPFYWDWWNSSYDSNQSEYTAQQQARQIDELSQEVQRLREQQEYAQAPPAPPAPAPTASARADVKTENDLPVVLVFLDKRIQEVKNYAIANEVLTSFDDHHVKKFPLADIDLAATMKLNDERGVSFDLPNPTASE